MFKVIAVDDEQNALNRFERLISQDSRLTLLSTFTKPLEALEYAKNNHVDIAFLDIEMPGMTGLELAESLMDYNPYIEIVFVTAYNQYALEAFRAHATGYLLKPLSREDFTAQIDIMEKKLSKERIPKDDMLYVSCLGSFSIRRTPEEGENIRFRTSKAEELLAFLIHSEGRSRSKDMILDSLWPDADLDKAANNFRVTCTYIRNTLADLGYIDILLRDHDDYSVNISRIKCDYIEFRKKVNNISELSLSEAQAAIALYKGPYLENRFYDWAEDARGWLENRYVELLYRAASLCVEADKIDNAIINYEAILSIDLYEENAIKEVIKLKALKLPPSAVKEYYNRYCNLLYEEYGSEPSRELKDLMKNF
ncbi:MAG: response regulator [Lachnospiraceae bacterium]|nr:response regulator [Lachnospiraceae bacterium]MBO7600189.1 response regulator [Lachnospiraceae bacterium]